MPHEYLVGEAMEEYAVRRRAEMSQEKSYEVRYFGFGGRKAFVPSDLGNLAAWFAFGRSITSAAGNVSQWDDQSGLGRHLKQATGTNQPALQSDGSILLDGIDNYMACDPFAFAQPLTIYLLLKQVTWTAADNLCDGNTGNTCGLQQSGASPNFQLSSGLFDIQNANLAVGVYGAIGAVFNGASSVSQVNNTVAVTGNPGAGNPGGFFLGARPTLVGFSNIQVKEVILYSAAHDANQRAQVINYLAGVGSL